MIRFHLRIKVALLGCTLVLPAVGCGGTSDSAAPALPNPPNAGNNSDENNTSLMQTNIRHNLQQLNAYRTGKGLAPLALDAGLSEFARQGSLELMRNHAPHRHFADAGQAGTLFGADGFRGAAAENQGDPNGWTPMAVNAAIDDILRAMIAEGPDGGHYDNIMNPALKRVGVGLVLDAKGQLYFTNDFSG